MTIPSEKNGYLPIMLGIADIAIIVVGGGKVALKKVQGLLRFTNDITVIAPDVCHEISQLPVKIIKKNYSADNLMPKSIVFACTNDLAINRKIAKDAAKMGLLVNVADNPKLSTFISPAVFCQNEMTVAISSSGKAVGKTVLWRDKIKALFDQCSS